MVAWTSGPTQRATTTCANESVYRVSRYLSIKYMQLQYYVLLPSAVRLAGLLPSTPLIDGAGGSISLRLGVGVSHSSMVLNKILYAVLWLEVILVSILVARDMLRSESPLVVAVMIAIGCAGLPCIFFACIFPCMLPFGLLLLPGGAPPPRTPPSFCKVCKSKCHINAADITEFGDA